MIFLMNILITGIKGQLGREIIKTAPRSIYGEKINLILVNRNKLDLSNAYECGKLIREYKPEWLINCAAFTNVEKSGD